MKYKAKAGFKDLENKYFGIHKANALLDGKSVEVTDFNNIPKEVQSELELAGAKKNKKKANTKKQKAV